MRRHNDMTEEDTVDHQKTKAKEQKIRPSLLKAIRREVARAIS
jgi:hypothetical protein